MVSKDQAIGGAILVVCTVIAILYVVGMFGYTWITEQVPALRILEPETVSYWLVAAPVLIAFLAILFIGAWIGWTMATTPPPKPIEEITTEIEDKKEPASASEGATEESKKKK